MYKQLERYMETKGRVRIAKYSRCSSDEQKKNGYTVKDQLDYIEIFARENDLIVVDEYVDEGISATLEINKRKALAQLIADAKAGKFDIVVFKCIDRFFRNTEEYYTAQKQLRKSGVTWISIEEPDLDPDDADAAFKINIYLAMAEYEARKTSKRIRFNNKMRVKNKQVVTGGQNFMFPWKVVGEPKNKHLVKNTEKEQVTYELLDHYEMHQSKHKTMKYANETYGLNVSMVSLTALLTNTLLYGEYKGVQNYVEPYITKERFDRIQETLKRNARYAKNSPSTFIFSGLVRCPICGWKLAGNVRRRNSDLYNSYRCNKHRQKNGCTNNKSFSEKRMETILIANLGQYIENEIAKIETIAEAKLPPTNNEKRIEELKKEISRLNTMFRKGRIEEEEYDKEYAALDNELKQLDTEAAKPIERDLRNLKALLESDYKTMYEKLDKEHKKAFWRKVIKEFTVREDRTIDPDSIVFFN